MHTELHNFRIPFGISIPNSRVCGIYTVFHDKQVLESDAWIYILIETA